MKVNEVITEGPLDSLRGHWANLKQKVNSLGDPSEAGYPKRTHKRLYNDWLAQSRRDMQYEPNYNVNNELLAFADQAFPSTVTKIPAPKLSGANDFQGMSKYLLDRTNEYYNSLNQPPPTAPVPSPAPPPAPTATATPAPAPAAKPATPPATPAFNPGRSASPSRMVRSHPYNGRGYEYDVINDKWTDNYTNKVVTDPQLIDQLNISYNRANQRVTPYNITPAQQAAQKRAQKQQRATQQARSQLGIT